MGMDVYGKSPIHQDGEYFRRSVWGWRPLADCIVLLAGEESRPCRHWHSNDGDGLTKPQSLKLATKLKELLRNGEIGTYIARRDAVLAAMPDKPCQWCHGTGVRNDAVGVSLRFNTREIITPGHSRFGRVGWCNGCDGVGYVRPFATHYNLAVADVTEFVTFLEACGGFNIC